LADPQSTDQDELSRAVEAADRAGSIVSEHVRSIIDAAQTRAAEIERSAQQDADGIRTEAYETAKRVLEKIDALEGRLGGLVNGLRAEASSLSGNLERRA
jgi:cell division septum initiation protein DivIVA